MDASRPEDSQQAVWLALGALTTAWSTYEFCLFLLFEAIMRIDPYKARILWFNLASLDLRIKLIRRIVNEGGAGPHREAVLALTKRALSFNEQRNKFVHWQWAKSTTGWKIFGFRDLLKEWHEDATAGEVAELAVEIGGHGKEILQLARALKSSL